MSPTRSYQSIYCVPSSWELFFRLRGYEQGAYLQVEEGDSKPTNPQIRNQQAGMRATEEMSGWLLQNRDWGKASQRRVMFWLGWKS